MVDIKKLFELKDVSDLENLTPEQQEGFKKLASALVGSLTTSQFAYTLPEQTLDAIRKAAESAYAPIDKTVNAALKAAAAGVYGQYTSQMHEMLESHKSPFEKLLEQNRKEIESLKIEPINREHIRSFFVNPNKFEPENLAEKKIEAIAEEIENRENALPIGKGLRIYVAFGSREILVSSFSAKGYRQIEVKGFDGEKFVEIIIDCVQLQILFEETDLLNPVKDETIH